MIDDTILFLRGCAKMLNRRKRAGHSVDGWCIKVHPDAEVEIRSWLNDRRTSGHGAFLLDMMGQEPTPIEHPLRRLFGLPVLVSEAVAWAAIVPAPEPPRGLDHPQR